MCRVLVINAHGWVTLQPFGTMPMVLRENFETPRNLILENSGGVIFATGKL